MVLFQGARSGIWVYHPHGGPENLYYQYQGELGLSSVPHIPPLQTLKAPQNDIFHTFFLVFYYQ